MTCTDRKVPESLIELQYCPALPTVLFSYPPKELLVHDGNVSLAELGLRSGETLIVEEQSTSAGGGKITRRMNGEDKSAPKLVRKFVVFVQYKVI